MNRAEVAAELERLYESRGRLVPADVVESAADPASPMHTHFEWDDTEAAQRYRMVQAAGLIRSFKVTITHETPAGEVEDLRVRSWIAARRAGDEDAPEGYVPERLVRENPHQRDMVLRQMLRDVAVLRRRYQHLTEFWQQVATLVDEASESQAS